MKVVISHGSFGKPHENWIPWLEEKLDEAGIEYLAPTFPTPNHQDYYDWATVLDMYKKFGCFDADSIFVGHSCGSVFLAKYIIERGLHCKGYISVSGYNNFWGDDDLMNRLNASFYLDDAMLSELPSYANKVVSFHSDNDPFIPQYKLVEFAKTISAEEKMVKGGGHINKSAGMTEFEQLFNAIVTISQY